MTRINKRLDDLEDAGKGKKGHLVLYARPDQPGYTERSPWSKDPGRRYTEAEKQDLADRVDLLIVEYTREWRSYGEP